MIRKKPLTSKQIVNKRAKYDYDIKNTITAGIVLSGAETKSLRLGHGHLKGAFANIKDGELWLYNATINSTNINSRHLTEDQQTRARKLLVNKKELEELATAKDQGLTIIPVKILTNGRYIKVVISVGKGMKKYDKRQKIKKREEIRNIEREISAKR